MKKNIYLQLIILALSILFVLSGCSKGESKKETVKILIITGNFPEKMYLEVITIFRSTPTKFGCKFFDISTGKFTPLKEYKTYTINSSGETQDVFLTWICKSKCKWKYREIHIIVRDAIDSTQTEKIVMYNDRGDVQLSDTINILCEHCVNPNIDPPFYYSECWKFHKGEKLRSLFYNMEGITKDTTDLTINIWYESDSVSICDKHNRKIYEEKLKEQEK